MFRLRGSLVKSGDDQAFECLFILSKILKYRETVSSNSAANFLHSGELGGAVQSSSAFRAASIRNFAVSTLSSRRGVSIYCEAITAVQ